MTARPSRWDAVALGDLLAVRYGKALPSALRDDAERFPVVGSAGRMTATSVPLANSPAVIIGRKGSVGSVHYEPHGSWPIDTTYYMQVPEDCLDGRFLMHQLRALDLRRLDSSTAVPSLRRHDLESQRLVIPPVDEQRRVVDILEDHLSRLNAADEWLGRSRIRAKTLEGAVLDSVIGVGDERCLLGELLSGVEAGRSFGGSAAPAGPGEWGIIKVSAMTWGAFRPEENKAVPETNIDPRFEIRPGDVLVSRANTTAYVGASVLVKSTPSRLLLSDKSLRLILREDVDPEWLVFALTAPRVRRQISARATGTKDSMRNISQAGLRSVEVPVRTLHQQRKDAARAAQLLDASADMGAATLLHQRRSGLLRRAILAAAFSGRLTGHTSDLVRAEAMAG